VFVEVKEGWMDERTEKYRGAWYRVELVMSE